VSFSLTGRRKTLREEAACAAEEEEANAMNIRYETGSDTT
jgi:hypothetical protein